MALTTCMVVLLLGSINYAKKSSDDLFETNIEALSDGEGGIFYLGHHYERCGHLIIEWNGLPANCTNLKTVCDFDNHNECQYKGCPIHG